MRATNSHQCLSKGCAPYTWAMLLHPRRHSDRSTQPPGSGHHERMLRLSLVSAVTIIALFLAGCGGEGNDDGATSEDTDKESTRTTVSSRPTPSSAQLEDLTKLSVPGYVAADASLNPIGAAVTYTSEKKTAGDASVLVRVTLAPCDGFICAGLDPKEYEGAETQRNLKTILPSAHIENPALRWEFGAFKLSSNATGLYYYALSYVESKGADGSVSRSSANSFRAWYHNGMILISLDVFSRSSSSVLSALDLEKRMTKAEAEQAARDVFVVFEPKLPK